MGCLKNFINAIILTLAIIGFISIGGKDLVVKYIGPYFKHSQESMLEKAKKVGDFSGINEEFEIERAAGIMGYNAVVAEHKASGQKLVVVDSGNKQLITAEDLKSDAAEQKIKTAIGKFKNQSASIEDFKVTKRGTMNAFGKTAPYVKFEAKVSKLPFGDIGGIISVVENSEGEQRVLLAANENSKYSQLISDEFFKQIK